MSTRARHWLRCSARRATSSLSVRTLLLTVSYVSSTQQRMLKVCVYWNNTCGDTWDSREPNKPAVTPVAVSAGTGSAGCSHTRRASPRAPWKFLSCHRNRNSGGASQFLNVCNSFKEGRDPVGPVPWRWGHGSGCRRSAGVILRSHSVRELHCRPKCPVPRINWRNSLYRPTGKLIFSLTVPCSCRFNFLLNENVTVVVVVSQDTQIKRGNW
jgi:hypothetical protein